MAVFQSLHGPVFRYFVVRGLDSATAEELAQDVLLIVYRRACEVRDRERFHGWLFRVARNALLQHVRKPHPAVESLADSAASERRLHVAEYHMPEESALFDWMEVLETDEREICLMRYLDGLDYQSIGDALELPMGTVKWKLHQVKKKIAVRVANTNRGTPS